MSESSDVAILFFPLILDAWDSREKVRTGDNIAALFDMFAPIVLRRWQATCEGHEDSFALIGNA